MPYVILVLAPGFERGTERYDLAVTFCRITFPYLVFISITTLQGGVLNALDRYGPFAFAYTLFNICLIGGLLLTLAQINRYSTVTITVADPSLATKRMSGIFRVGDTKAFVSAIEKYFELKATWKSEQSMMLDRR
jgi:hypothetical protein